MAIQSQPSRIPEPFAGSGTKNTIPATNATPSASQAASWASGFPPECSQPISAGGCPVPRNDVNGALNQLSQDFAFRQDGGVWEWSALADYDTQRMVRGSDGLIYWSVAQNGPGFASGAVDPTTDDGTYWSSPLTRTVGVLNRSTSIATTQWVQEAFGPEPVYIDPVSGSDSNDGLTPGTALRTIAQALALTDNRTGASQAIYLAGGSYAEDVNIISRNIELILQNNVTVYGTFVLSNNSVVFLENADSNKYSLSISCDNVSANSVLKISNSSSVYSSCDINVASSGGTFSTLVSVDHVSSLGIGGVLTITGSSSASYALQIVDLSGVYCNGVSISATNVSTGVYILISSILSVSGNPATVSISGTNLSYAINASFCGGISFGRVAFSVEAPTCLSVANNSFANISFCSGTITGKNGGSCVSCLDSSSVFFEGSTSNISFVASSSIVRFIQINRASSCFMANGTYAFSGTATTSIVGSYANSYFLISPSCTLSGTPSGKRYNATRGGQIDVSGGGENRIPGSAAGTVNSAEYSYYG